MAGVPVTEDAAGYCEQLVRQADRRRYLAALFAPAAQRPALFAIYAVNSEIARVREVAREPLPGELRLQWWREVLGGERAEEARAHLVAAALLDTLGRYRLAPQPLLDLIEARAFDLYDEPMTTPAELETYLARTSGTVFQMAAKVLAAEGAEKLAPLSRHAGIAYGIADLLRVLPRHASRRQLYVPLEVLQRHQAKPEDIFAARATPELRAALAEMRALARDHLAQARDFLRAAPPAALSAFLPAALTKPLLQRMDRPDCDPFSPTEPSAWRQQWILWRASRKAHAMLD